MSHYGCKFSEKQICYYTNVLKIALFLYVYRLFAKKQGVTIANFVLTICHTLIASL